MDDIFVLDRNYKKIAIIDAYESLIWTERFNSYGEFELYLAPNTELLETLAINNYLKKANSDTVMIISTRELVTDIENGDHLTVRGKSLETILERRIVWSQTTFQGTKINDAIKKLIDDSITSPSLGDRKIDNFVYDGPVSNIIYATDQVTVQFTGDNLYDAIQSICAVGDISFKVLLNDGKFHFKLFSGTDRSYAQEKLPRVLFKENMENLISTNYYNSVEDYCNVSLVAGAGEGKDRKTYVVGSATGMDRRELYTDARDISDEDDSGKPMDSTIYNYLLNVRGQEKLLEKKISEIYESKMETKTQYEFNKDYFIGDTVELANKYGIQAQTVVSEVVESQDDSGYSIVPTFTTKNATIQSGIPGGDSGGDISSDAMIIAGNNIYKPFVLTTFDSQYQEDGYMFVSNASSGYVEFTLRRKFNRNDVQPSNLNIDGTARGNDTGYSDLQYMPKIIYRTRDPIDVSNYSKLHVIYELSNKVWKVVNPNYGTNPPASEILYLLENVDDTVRQTYNAYMNYTEPSYNYRNGGESWLASIDINPRYSDYRTYESVSTKGGSTIIGFVSEYSTDVDKYTVDNSYNVTGYFEADNQADRAFGIRDYMTKTISNINYAWGAKEILIDSTVINDGNLDHYVDEFGYDNASYITRRSVADIAISSKEKQYIKIGVSTLAGDYESVIKLPDRYLTYIDAQGKEQKTKARSSHTQIADPHKPVFTGTVKKKTYAGSGYAKYDYIDGKENNYFPYETYVETKLRIYGMYLT